MRGLGGEGRKKKGSGGEAGPLACPGTCHMPAQAVPTPLPAPVQMFLPACSA